MSAGNPEERARAALASGHEAEALVEVLADRCIARRLGRRILQQLQPARLVLAALDQQPAQCVHDRGIARRRFQRTFREVQRLGTVAQLPLRIGHVVQHQRVRTIRHRQDAIIGGNGIAPVALLHRRIGLRQGLHQVFDMEFPQPFADDIAYSAADNILRLPVREWKEW